MKLVFFHHFLDDTFPIVFQNPYRRDLNEYYIAQMIEDCCYILAILIGNGKTIFLVYALLCDDLTLLYLELCI